MWGYIAGDKLLQQPLLARHEILLYHRSSNFSNFIDKSHWTHVDIFEIANDGKYFQILSAISMNGAWSERIYP